MGTRRITAGLIFAALALCGTLAARSLGAGGPVSAYPTAGTVDASPMTQISFRGAGPAELGRVEVTGSVTGRHTGRLEAHSDGDGASFFPDRPFRAREAVAVRAARPLIGSRRGRVTFRVATLPGDRTVSHDEAARAAGSGGAGAAASGPSKFHSVSGFRPPSIDVLTRRSGRARGDIFLAPKSGQRAAMIVDDSGKLVWYHPAPPNYRIYDFRRQRYGGHNDLTWIEYRDCRLPECGIGRIYDRAYRKVASVRAGNGYAADFHDFTISPQSTAYMIISQPVQADLRSVGGPSNGWMFDSIVQEIDVPTGAVRFEWHALDHIPLTRSGLRYSHDTFDPYHVNSVDQESDGNLLISARNTDAVFEIDRASGRVLWQLGGNGSSYRMGRGASFIAQHDARRQRNGEITIFDNGLGAGLGDRPARGIVLELKGGKAYLRHALQRAKPVYANSQGNVQGLPTGGYFVGWGGHTPYFSEFDGSGRMVYDAQFAGTQGNSYRAFRFAWHGRPSHAPAVAAAAASGGRVKVWVSWNGATEVASWQLFAGPHRSSLQPVKTVARRGFETSISFAPAKRYVQVRALDAQGHLLGASGVTSVTGGG